MLKRKIQITVERYQLLIRRQRQTSTKVWCDLCSCQVETLTVADYVETLDGGLMAILGEVQAGSLHVIKMRTGDLVCLNSLGSREG